MSQRKKFPFALDAVPPAYVVVCGSEASRNRWHTEPKMFESHAQEIIQRLDTPDPRWQMATCGPHRVVTLVPAPPSPPSPPVGGA